MNSMRALLDHYGSNKGETYGGLYDVLLYPIRNKISVLIEIGIGTLMPDVPSTMNGYTVNADYRPGGSLRAFRDYCSNAAVYGLDIQLDTQFHNEDRITTMLGDSTKVKPGTFRNDWANIIIDDGLHTPDAQLATLQNFWPVLKDGGLYVIEDVLPETEDIVRARLPAVPFCVARSHLAVRWIAIVLRKCAY